MPIPPNIRRTGRPLGSRSSYSPGWLRKQYLDEMRRRGVRRVLGELDAKTLAEHAIKLEPKDITTQTSINIRVVSIPAKAPAGAPIEPADYHVIGQQQTPGPVASQQVDVEAQGVTE